MRIRSLKPGFFKNEELCELSPWHRLAFEGLWLCADREGRLEDRPRRLKADIFPYDDLDLDRILWDLSAAQFIVRYEHDGKSFIWIPTWDKHQHPRQDEGESILPAYERGSERVTISETKPSRDSDGPVTVEIRDRNANVTAQRMGNGVLGLGSGVLVVGSGETRGARAQDLVEAWNATTHPPIPRCRELTDGRRRQIRSRMLKRPKLAEWVAIFARIQASAFCRGEIPGRDGKAGWVADFDWILANDTNAAKVLEGKYDDRSPPGPNLGKTSTRLFEAISQLQG